MRVLAIRMGPGKVSHPFHVVRYGYGRFSRRENRHGGQSFVRLFAPDPQSATGMAHIVHKPYRATMIFARLYINRPRHPQ